MRIPSSKTDQVIYFVAVDSADLKTRKTGLTSFTVYRSRNGGTATVYTTPTVAELSAANMPGVYSLLIDEDTTIAAGSDSEEYAVHITQASMAPVSRTIELYRRDTTSGRTLAVDATSHALADVDTIKTNPVVNAGTVTFPTTATLASTTNITAGTIATVTTLTNLPAIPANWLTAAGAAADFGTEIAAAVWQDAVAGDFQVASSIGKSLYTGNVVPGGTGGHFIAGANAATSITTALTANITGNLSGTVGSVTGAVASVTGAVGSVTGAVGSVTGAVGSVTGAVGSVTAAVTITQAAADLVWGTAARTLTALPAIPNNWITAAGVAASALNDRGNWNVGKSGYALTQAFPANFSALSITAGGLADITQTAADRVWSTVARTLTSGAGIVLAKGVGITGLNDLDAAGVAAATWDATLASHLTGGSTGAALNAAGSAGDPWNTALPGAYAAGTAGKIIGDRIDAAITSRLADGVPDVNLKSVNGVTVTGLGTVASPWGPA